MMRLSDRVKGYERVRTMLKIPVNVLMFCSGLKVENEEFEKKLLALKNERVGGAFELDMVRAGTLEMMRKIVSMEDSLQVYELLGRSGKVLFAGTEYFQDGNKIEALIQCDLRETGQSYLTVYSQVRAFREVVARNLLDLLTRIQ